MRETKTIEDKTPKTRTRSDLREMLKQEHTKVEDLSESLIRYKESVQFAAETVTRLEAEAAAAANRNRQLLQENEDLTGKIEAEKRVLRWYATVLVSTVRAGEKLAREK